MNPQPIAQPTPGLDLGDIYYVLFRHKWKILLCSLAGLITAGVLYRMDAPPYQSEAKLLVRYIIAESKTSGPANASGQTRISPDERGASIMNTEREILTSANIIREVVETIGAEKILAKVDGGKEAGEAIVYITKNLFVNVGQSSTVINISFQHPDAELVTQILREIIDRYLKLHVEAHRSAGALGEALQAEADTLRARLPNADYDARRWWRSSDGVQEVLNELLAYLYVRFLFFPMEAEAEAARPKA